MYIDTTCKIKQHLDFGSINNLTFLKLSKNHRTLHMKLVVTIASQEVFPSVPSILTGLIPTVPPLLPPRRLLARLEEPVPLMALKSDVKFMMSYLNGDI